MTFSAAPCYDESANVSLIDPSVDLRWLGTGSEDSNEVYTWLRTNLPSTYFGLYLQNYHPVHKGGGVWEIALHYGREKPLFPNYYTFSAETVGGTLHREQSLDTEVYVDNVTIGAIGVAPDVGGLIGVSESGVEGVDVPDMKFAFTIQKKLYPGSYPNDFLNDIFLLTGCINESPVTIQWKGQLLVFKEGELRFMGAIISDPGRDPDGNELMDIAFKFEASADREDISVGLITGIKKGGWDYLWVLWEPFNSNNVRVKRPIAVYVEKVHFSGDFNKLLI